jgi:hypothetical protein
MLDLKKIGILEQEISGEKGDFSLFGLFLRTEAQDRWDVLVSAPWLEKDKRKGLDYLTERLRAKLDPDELLSISRIVILERGNPVLDAINKAISVRHGKVEIRDTTFSGIQIAQACISTSSSPDADISMKP